MSKVKLTTVSGQVIEKPIVSCFKGTYGTYLVLDNEANGSMGLPIILVTKIFNNKAIYIDDGEWQTVKENLKSIIAGNKLELTTVPNEMPADDVFYKQLTLPVNSFDVLKKSFESTPNAQPEAPVAPSIPETPAPTVEPPVSPVMPEQPVTPPVTPEVTPAPVVPDIVPPMPDIAPIEPTPTVEQPVSPVMPPEVPTPPVQETVTEPMPEQPVLDTNNNLDYGELKANFMKSCESMFDALVSKMQNK